MAEIPGRLHGMEESDLRARPAPPPLACKHGVKAAVEILDFLIELIKKDPSMGREQIEETIVFALDMIHAGECGVCVSGCVMRGCVM